MKNDYSIITELPKSKVTQLQVERAYHRYKFAALHCEGKDVLEVACGCGQGLGLLSRFSKQVVGGDCDDTNLSYALNTYDKRNDIKIQKMDAQSLPFEKDSFDTVILYEAIYYLQSVEKFLNECRRVLRSGGRVIVCTANKDWPDFNPSPFSIRYYSVPEMRDLFEGNGFSIKFYGAFPDNVDGCAARARSLLKRTAVKLHLMPKTMKGKVLLKKLFMGTMVEYPAELTDGQCVYLEPIVLPPDRSDRIHTAIYAVASLEVKA